MTQFHEGQEVEVWCFPDGDWEKAKLIWIWPTYKVEFPDGSRASFDAEHIRGVDPRDEKFPLPPSDGGHHERRAPDHATPHLRRQP